MSLKERIDAQREGYDSPLQLVPEGQAFPGAAEAGRVSRDLATPLRLNAALTLKIWSEIYLPGVLMALVWIVFLFHSMVDIIKGTSARTTLCRGVAGAGHVGVCKFSLW